jgi:hypothetical protein
VVLGDDEGGDEGEESCSRSIFIVTRLLVAFALWLLNVLLNSSEEGCDAPPLSQLPPQPLPLPPPASQPASPPLPLLLLVVSALLLPS